MKKRIVQMTALLVAVLLMGGCSLTSMLPDVTTGRELPHLMVQSIDVSMMPRDPEFVRHYQTQENLTALLNLLREISTNDIPEEEPKLNDGQTYYTVAVTYATGQTREYYIQGYRFLKLGDDPWCEISHEDAMRFTQYIRDHQSDDGSYIPPTTEPPAETSVPTDASTPPTE